MAEPGGLRTKKKDLKSRLDREEEKGEWEKEGDAAFR